MVNNPQNSVNAADPDTNTSGIKHPRLRIRLNKLQLTKKLLSFLPLLSFAAIISCGETENGEEEPVPVKTTSPELHTSALTKSYPAQVRATKKARVSFRVAGPIDYMPAKEGKFVEKGELLAQMDTRDYETLLEATEAKYKEVKRETGRIISLHEKGRVTDSERDKAESGLKQIRAKYRSHKNQLEDTRLTAPFDGQITKQFFSEGETVDKGIPVVSIVDTSQVEIVAHLAAPDYLKKDDFVEILCKTPYQPGHPFSVELEEISAQANMNGLYPAYFKAENKTIPTLRPGMSAEIKITYRTGAEKLYKVPASSLFRRENRTKLWLIDKEEMRAGLLPVEIKEVGSSGDALIKAELDTTDIIVSAGVHSLSDGQKVKPLTSSPRQ